MAQALLLDTDLLIDFLRGQRKAVFNQIPVDSETAAEGGLFRRDFGPSNGTGLIDAILAATALKHGLLLVTLNDKHYPMLPEVIVPYRKR